MKKRWLILGGIAALSAGLYLANTSRGGAPTGELTLLAHRGVHQPFSRYGLTDETCTAAQSWKTANSPSVVGWTSISTMSAP